MPSDPDPKVVHSPLDSLLERLEQNIHLRKLDLVSRLGPVESAIRAYRLAVENSLAHEFAASHGLSSPKATITSPKAAAMDLLRAVQALPELASRSTEALGTPEVPAPALVGKSKKPAPPPAAISAEDTAFPKIFERSHKARLVIVGALSGKRKAFPEPWAEAIEWLDTSSGGTHATGNLATRIKQGRVLGLILCDRAIQHKHSEPLVAAARAYGTPIAFADKGGAASILAAFEAIERQL
jgi:hypothetical protein